MDRLAFEQLVSAWLDDRQNSALRLQIEVACAADPLYGRLLAEYEQLENIIGQARTWTPSVDWVSYRNKVSAAVAGTEPRAPDSPEIDGLLRRALPGVDARVDWERYARHVSAALDEAASPRRILRLQRWRPLMAMAGLAAAAAVVLWIGLRTGQAPVAEFDAGTAIVSSEPPARSLKAQPLPALAPPIEIAAVAEAQAEGDAHDSPLPLPPTPAPAVASAAPRARSVVRVLVIEEQTPAPAIAQGDYGAGIQSDTEPEVFFMLEPPDRTLLASAAGYGSR